MTPVKLPASEVAVGDLVHGAKGAEGERVTDIVLGTQSRYITLGARGWRIRPRHDTKLWVTKVQS